jgi:NAD+ kinase
VNVAVRGADDAVSGAVGGSGTTLVAEDATRQSPDVVVAAGADAIRSVATDPPSVPVLLVTTAGGRHLVARASLDVALADVAAGDAVTRSHPVVGVRRDGGLVSRALRDVALVTAAPASISEYAVVAGETTVASVRADGVVVATPLGSDGYAAAAGGAVLEVGTGLTVVPISPFSTASVAHVVDQARGISISVERDGEVALYVDGVRDGSLDVDDSLHVACVDSVDVVTPSAG